MCVLKGRKIPEFPKIRVPENGWCIMENPITPGADYMARFLELRHLLWTYTPGGCGVEPSTLARGSNTFLVFGAQMQNSDFFFRLATKNCPGI